MRYGPYMPRKGGRLVDLVPRSLLARLALVCLAVVTSPACADGCDSCADCSCEECMTRSAYDRGIHDATARYEYTAPPTDAWKQLRDLLHEKGYELAETTPVEGKTLTTSANAGTAYNVHLARIDPKRYRITLEAQADITLNDGGTEHTSERDHALEWELIQRVEPTNASAVEAKATKRGERAGRVGRGCDRGCECVCDTCETVVPPLTPPPGSTGVPAPTK